MQNEIASHSVSHACYVLRIDGRVKSTHQRFVEALRAGLQLKDQFPDHDIKVGFRQTRNSTEEITLGTALL